MQPVTLTPGGNAPLEGRTIAVELAASSLGGVRWVAEEAGGPRVIPSGESTLPITVRGLVARLTVTLPEVAPDVTRLRLVAFSDAPTRILTPADARVSVDGTHRFTIAVNDPRGVLTASEVLELYRRHGQWKVRAVAAGWNGHIAQMAQALSVPAAAFSAPAAAPASSGSSGGASGGAAGGAQTAGGGARPAPRRIPTAASMGESPAVGPVLTRDLLDDILGPGDRSGTDSYVDVELAGVSLRVVVERQPGGVLSVAALTPLGNGRITDQIAGASLRCTGDAALGRVTLTPSGAAAQAIAVLDAQNLSSAVLKALMAETWTIGADFARRARPLGWSVHDDFADHLPRELRLGIAEELQTPAVWGEVRTDLLRRDGMFAMVDDPATVLLADQDGQLTIGPSTLGGTNRAWSIIIERVIRADLPAGHWQQVATMNADAGAIRFGVFDEPGTGGAPALTASFAALQLPRTQLFDDLQRGLNWLDEATGRAAGQIRAMFPRGTVRLDLPANPRRHWTGPGGELKRELLARELADLPAGSPAPAGFLERVRGSATALGRPGTGYLAHLALQRAERGDAAAASWRPLARSLVAMTPLRGPDKCAVDSIYLRQRALEDPSVRPTPIPDPPPAPPRPSSRPARPRPTPTSRPQPDPGQSAPPPAPDPSPGQSRPKKRWRLFN